MSKEKKSSSSEKQRTKEERQEEEQQQKEAELISQIIALLEKKGFQHSDANYWLLSKVDSKDLSNKKCKPIGKAQIKLGDERIKFKHPLYEKPIGLVFPALQSLMCFKVNEENEKRAERRGNPYQTFNILDDCQKLDLDDKNEDEAIKQLDKIFQKHLKKMRSNSEKNLKGDIKSTNQENLGN